MYYKEIPKNLLAKLQKPLEAVTEDAVTKRLNGLFPDKWKKEFTHKQLFALNLPMIGPRGMEVLTTISLWLIKNTITIPVEKDEFLSRTTYVITAVFDDESRQESERLAFMNTAIRGFMIGVTEKTINEISLERHIISRGIYLSERVRDHNLDVQAMKVLLAKEEEEESPADRRATPRQALPFFKSIPAAVTINRDVLRTDIFLLDFSSSGLKLISSFNFPKDKQFNLTLELKETVSLWCEVVWKNNLWEDLQHVGLKFVKLHLDKFELLCKYFEDIMPKKGGEDYRINRTLPVELTLWDQPRRMPTFIHSLSAKELRIIHPSYLKEGTKTLCRIYPFWNSPPIEGEVEVISSHIMKGGGCLAVMQYTNLSKESEGYLEDFIQKCIMEERRNKEK